MKVYTYTEAGQKLSAVLDQERSEPLIIKRKGGESFQVICKKPKKKSPFDVPGIKTKATTSDILEAVKDSRSR